jgi:hypothetical protein
VAGGPHKWDRRRFFASLPLSCLLFLIFGEGLDKLNRFWFGEVVDHVQQQVLMGQTEERA